MLAYESRSYLEEFSRNSIRSFVRNKSSNKYNEDFHVPIPVLEKIGSKMQTPAYEQALRSTSSLATRTLFNWTKALINYEIVFRKVEPQRQLL